MIFVDSNIPMYLVGSPHPHKDTARRLVEKCITFNERLVTDVAVLQEILHRFTAIRRKEAIQPAFDVLLGIVDEVFVVEEKDVVQAKDNLVITKQLSAHVAIHVAVMQRYGVTQILTFDTDFDTVSGILRVA